MPETIQRNACVMDSALKCPNNMDPAANYSIAHLYISIKIIFPDIMTSTSLETIFVLILNNTTFIKTLLEI